ncbi:PilT/PilU family type 4a pilus ATPase [Aliikangiella marina]|uniref:PilT/PilU family type 4a pilus ATPase n=1 Tax=Aliikangiella marina TaxID=1712262 RepID=A0A545T9A6_9GAMM|nr:PilT/PilU family type 4a pilus ATPase [Aliikangiella marina]TQV73801.1 PilT/PilU family type 4a pilus ATPase [Aliikangiella marina]
MVLKDYLRILAEKDGSDLFLSTGAPPSAKFHGRLLAVDKKIMQPGEIKLMAYELMDKEQIEEFEHRPEMNLAISYPDVGRFRVNIFQQRNQVSMVIRSIKVDIPNWRDLDMPEILPKLIMQKRGLILFVGGTGSGKSTSLAALIDYRNSNSSGHIITIEDPVEFVHKHKKSIINQREVGVDTESYEDALKNTLRQAPDVILIGEIRDAETMEHALAFAETGHLCISTLHANNANQALDRVVNFFPEERHKQLFLDLSLNLQAFVSQRLIPTVDGKRCAAVEILLGTPRVCDLIKKGSIDEIKEVMHKSENQGMQTFDTALYNLYLSGKISQEEALKNADSKNNLALKIRLSGEKKGQSSQPAARTTPASQTRTAASPENAASQAKPPPPKLMEKPPERKAASGGLSLEPIAEKSEDEEEANS